MDNTDILKNTEETIGHRLWCTLPYEDFNVFVDGSVYCCCPWYTDMYSIGNIHHQSVEEIWYGEKAQKLRQSIEDGSFKYCNLSKCIPIYNVQEMEIWNSFPEQHSKKISNPKHIQLNIEKVCNVKCITCRDSFIGPNSHEDLTNKKQIFDNQILPLCKNAKTVYMNGCGEFSVSKLSVYIIDKIGKLYPHIKFSLITNGILFDKALYEKLKLKNKILKLCISVHATTKETYDKIVINGNFDKVKENIEFFAREREKGCIDEVCLNFVVTSINYKEMIDFQKWANELQLTTHFSEYRKWGAKLDNHYDEYAIFEKTHPQYCEYMKIAQNEIFDSVNCEINSILRPKQ